MSTPNFRDVTELYGDGYQADSVGLDRVPAWDAHAVIFDELFGPHTFLDVGCGAGPLVRAMRIIGNCDAWGIEGSLAALGKSDERIIPWDLRVPLTCLRKFDLVTCFDVGEHVGNASAVADTCAAATGHVLLFGAAPPGQDGHGHIDCRPYEDWHDLFEARGLMLDRGETDWVRKRIRETEGTNMVWWVEKNLHVYKR